MGTSAFVIAGPAGTYDSDIDATHLLRLVEGDRAVWRVTSLHGPPGEVRGWWPEGPDRVGPDLFALLAVAVLGVPTTLPVDRGAVTPSAGDLAEVERLAAVTRQAQGLAVAVAALPGSTLDPGALGGRGDLGQLSAARLAEVLDAVA